MNTANENDVPKIIRAMDEEFTRLIAAGDLKQLTTNFYAEDAQFLPPNQAAIIGRPAIQEALGQMAAGLQKLTFRSDKIEVSGDFAYAIGRYELRIKTPSGAEIHDEGKYVVVYRGQQDGAWRAVADIFNSNLPAAQG
jgi:uncharacterized protein (TIGR02246 family)